MSEALPEPDDVEAIAFPHSPAIALRLAVERGAPGYLSGHDGRISFPELDHRSNQFANFLAQYKVNAGDRVAALMDNSIANIVAMLGTIKLGATWAPINTSFRGEWLRHQLKDSAPAILIVDVAHLEALLAADEPTLSRIQVLLHDTGEKSDRPSAKSEAFSQYLTFPASHLAYEPRPEDISHLIYTSGTTGRSKGCLVSHNYLCNYARLLYQNSPRLRHEVLYSPLPLFHLAATAHLVLNLVLGASAHFARRFSVSGFWDEIERTQASYIHLMGPMAAMVGAAPDTGAARRCYGKVRVLASAWSSETARKLKERFGIGISDLRMLGQTEASFLTSLRGNPRREGTVGLPTDSFEIRIVDAADTELRRGQVGEIVYRPLKPDVMFSGYWRDPEASWAKCRNMWWHSGDFGRQDDDGYVYFSDRGDDRLRRGGENISSFEMEQQFLKHPDLSAVAVHAVPGQLGDDEVKVVAVLRLGATLSAEALWEWAAPRLPRFAIPRYIEFRSDLPRNPTGKVLKYQLRKEGVTPDTWDRIAAGVALPSRYSVI